MAPCDKADEVTGGIFIELGAELVAVDVTIVGVEVELDVDNVTSEFESELPPCEDDGNGVKVQFPGPGWHP